MTEQEIIDKISKPATLFKVGGFRPSDDIKASWLGKVLIAKEGEEWPKYAGNPMTPLLQLNLSDIPSKPNNLNGIEFITVFIDEKSVLDSKDGTYIIRTYKSEDTLISLNQNNYTSTIKAFQLEPYLEENDCPSWDDCPVQIPDELEEDYESLFENKSGIKIGGWPSLVQSEIFWESDDFEYAFQIDSIEKANLQWGDGGVIYFGINSQTNDWSFEWQCF